MTRNSFEDIAETFYKIRNYIHDGWYGFMIIYFQEDNLNV